jgi:Domain of unknown function (DUF4386)
MSVMTARPAPASWRRWGTALGIPAVVLLAVSFAFAGNAPGSTDSDAKITSWYASTSHQHTQILGFLGFTLGVLCLIGFLAALRERMAAAEGTPAAMCELAFGAGIASAALFAMAIALFTVPALLASDTSATDIVPTTYRMFYTAGYASWVAATMIAALTVTATSATALRTSLLPRWFAWLGIPVGIIQLLGFFFIPGFAFWGWILITAALLLRRPRAGSPSGTPA